MHDLAEPVVREIAASGSTLVFTNTRSQAEIWYQLLLQSRPDWAGLVALHHGSIEKASREWVELGLKEGRLKAVVATSSLDLGVDFLPVERVLQIGSAKGVARLLQRACDAKDDEACRGLGAQYLCIESVCRAPCELCPPARR